MFLRVKKIVLVLSVFLTLNLPVFSINYGIYRLFANYTFDNGYVTDQCGNTVMPLYNNCQISHDPKRGNVLSFKAAEKGYAMISPVPIQGDTISLSFWFRRDSDDTDTAWKQIFEFFSPSDNSNIYLMPMEGWNKTNSCLVCDAKCYSTSVYESLNGPLIKADETWHHIVVVINGHHWSYYQDGTLVSSQWVTSLLSVQHPTQLYWGTNPNRGGFVMSGALDDIRIYHYPLSASQVNQLYLGETVTDPSESGANRFAFENDLTDETGRLKLSGNGYSFSTDTGMGTVLSMEEGHTLYFTSDPIPDGASTISFLYKKSFSDTDDGKYLYQATDSTGANGYGLKLKRTDGKTYLVLETLIKSTATTYLGTYALNDGDWNAITMTHAVAENDTAGVMRIFQNGIQTKAASRIRTFVLRLNKWGIGSTAPTLSAGGLYDEWTIDEAVWGTSDITGYYSRNLKSIQLCADCKDTCQTIRDFGASDAWYVQSIGQHWSESARNHFAELLFSKDMDENGNPKGIGLSCWRFNIGSGSYEQGSSSGISAEDKRTECFLKADGTYDWSKQSGQQWFLEQAAKTYHVEDIIGFVNAPPVYYTKYGVAFNSKSVNSSILKDNCYDDYATFVANVVRHFDTEGIHFDYISPLNEPDYLWNGDGNGTAEQEGSPWTNEQIVKVAVNLDSVFQSDKLSTKLLIGESSSLGVAVNQLPVFWGNTGRFASLPTVARIFSSHSYWNDGSASDLYTYHQKMQTAVAGTSVPVEYMQTEYSLLGNGYQWGHPDATTGSFSEIECGLSLARMIHSDLAFSNATGWQFWTAFEPTNHYGESRFGLIEALSMSDKTDGIVNECKLLYVLGQYSRFIRPGMKRIALTRSDNVTDQASLSAQFFSAYMDKQTGEVVFVATNTATASCKIDLSVCNQLTDSVMVFRPYITSGDYNLKALDEISPKETFVLPGLSIVTFVGRNTNNINHINEEKLRTNNLVLNCGSDVLYLNGCTHCSALEIWDISGKRRIRQAGSGRNSETVPVSNLEKGLYIVRVYDNNGTTNCKFVKYQ